MECNKKTTISLISLDLWSASRKTDSRFPAWASSQSWRCAPLPAQGKSLAATRNQFRRAKQWQCTKKKNVTWFLSFFPAHIMDFVHLSSHHHFASFIWSFIPSNGGRSWQAVTVGSLFFQYRNDRKPGDIYVFKWRKMWRKSIDEMVDDGWSKIVFPGSDLILWPEPRSGFVQK